MRELILILCIVLGISSCNRSSGPLVEKNTENGQKILYDLNSGKPYSGRLLQVANNEAGYKYIHFKKYYKKGKLHNDFTEYFGNGKIKQEGKFRNGLPIDFWKEYYPNGQTKKITEYKNGKKVNLQKEFYESAQLKNEKYYFEGLLTGKSTSYHPDGKILEQGLYQNNQKIGHWVQYYPDGKIKISTNFQEGLDHGEYIEYDSNGVSRMIITFSLGKMNGVIKKFHPNKNLAFIGFFKDNFPSGIWQYYDENGKLQKEENWDIILEKQRDLTKEFKQNVSSK